MIETATNNEANPPGRIGRSEVMILSGLSLVLVCYHLLTSLSSDYGYFVDEVYYIACSKRLAFGYVDQPPLSIFLLALVRWLLGESVTALRVVPALAVAGTVFLTGLIAHRLGGNRRAIIVAALAVFTMPTFLVLGSFYSMNALEIVMCAAVFYALIMLVQEKNPKYWLLIGLLTGLGLELKHTMVLYIVAAGVGLLATPARRLLWNRWFAGGALIVVVLLLPNFLWQYSHGFPSLEFYRNAMVLKNVPTGPVGILLNQILFANPLALPLWVAGVIYFLFVRGAGNVRFLGWTWLVLMLFMIFSQSSRPDRISSVYPILFAGGAVAFQTFRSERWRSIASITIGVLLIIGALVLAPASTPLLSPPATQQYLSRIGFSVSLETGKMREPLPQWLGDRLGWHELAVEVARVVQSLSPEEQRNTVIVSSNYGHAGALEIYGKELGLPPVYATHNSYHLWGPPPDSVRTYIAVSVNRNDLNRLFESVTLAGMMTCEYCTRPQQKVPIYVARGPKFTGADWPKFKIFI